MKAIVNQTVVPLFSVPSHQSTVEDEVLFGMVVDILDHPTAGWYKIRTHYRYEGLVAEDALLLGDGQAAAWEALPKSVVLHKNCCDVLSSPKVQGWHVQHLTRGCVAAPVGNAENGWQQVLLPGGRSGYLPAGILAPLCTAPLSDDEAVLRQALVDRAMLYQGTHYRWGGKSPMGVDCSGLVSMAYMLCGILIYRDADIKPGFPIHPISLEEIKPGDLLFFPGHVAMYIGDGRYCHSTAKAGCDGFTVNSLRPEDPDYREDLAHQITQVGSFFPRCE